MTQVNFSVRQGDTFTRTVTITDASDAAVDITGATLRLHIRAKGSTTDAITAPTLTLTTPASGIATMIIAAADTATLSAATTYRYEIEMIDAGGAITTPLEGLIYCQEDLG